MKYLYFIRWEVRSPGQDCEPVLHCRWSRVGQAKVCSCDVTAGIISNGDTPGKRWTIIWNPVNCIPWVFFLHLAHKRFQPFIIVERKNKRFRSKAIATTGFWETKSTQNKKKKLNICFHVCLIKKMTSFSTATRVHFAHLPSYLNERSLKWNLSRNRSKIT